MHPIVRRFPALRASIAMSTALAAIVGGVLALDPNQALASHVHCGDTLTADTTLDEDLLDCPNNGVVIGADGITLDLNGHLIDGDGTEFAACAEDQMCDSGVLNDGHDGVTIRSGSARGFGIGVFIVRARHNAVLQLAASKNDLFGAVVAESARSEVRNGSFSRNIPPEGDGIGIFGSDQIKIVGNAIERNPGPGIHVEGSAGNLVKGNQLAQNGPSLLMEDADGNTVRANRIVRGAGILVAPGDDNVIVGNRVSAASDSLAVENGSGNVVARNLVRDSRGDGIRLGIGAPPFGGEHNVVRRNVVKRSSEDGFHVYPKDDHSLLRRNVAIGAGDDGFEVQNRTTKLTGNRAARNGDLGIRAVRGVIDGGHNVARHNGDRRQCTNIACR